MELLLAYTLELAGMLGGSTSAWVSFLKLLIGGHSVAGAVALVFSGVGGLGTVYYLGAWYLKNKVKKIGLFATASW
ncbi:hypothetical protein ACNA6I_23165 (plasmid) [Rossellomorea sp. FS2]|uniref:hypothetical protein n=1 Tax=Rossellomorea sp. FS2 TaxID=3391447 RepID=UPI003A4D824B